MNAIKNLVAVHVGPVQDFIAAARRTADLWAGSQFLLEVVAAAAAEFPDEGRIFPRQLNLGGANRILAVVDGDPTPVLARARAAAGAAVDSAWRAALAHLSPDQRSRLDEKRAERQISSLLEFYSAWVPLDEPFPEARGRVEQLLHGRKALRDFAPAAEDDRGIPKSPLNPGMASIRRKGELGPLADRPLHLKATETLDAVSILKRVRGTLGAGRVWSTRDLADGHPPRPRPSASDPDPADLDADYPYFAIVAADGDGMGALLNRLPSIDDHKRVAGQLDTFAARAKEMMSGIGQLVYAGGDDVLAFLPVSQALTQAKELAATFSDFTQGEVSLSVGVAVVHYRDPLSVGLERAREAERHAKQTKNALTLAVHTRGGVPATIRQPWTEFDLPDWCALFVSQDLPRGLPYELQQLAWEWPPGLAAEPIRAEVDRIMKRKDGATEDGRRAVNARLAAVEDAKQLEDFVSVLKISRFLSAGTPQGAR